MHETNIKRNISKQLKKHFPNWKKLPRKQKKAIASQVQKEVVQNYSFKGPGKY